MSESLVKVSSEFLSRISKLGDQSIEVIICVNKDVSPEQVQTDLAQVGAVLSSVKDSLNMITVHGKKEELLSLIELSWVERCLRIHEFI